MANAWLTHVKNTMKLHPGLKLKEVLKLAKKSYKKGATAVASGTKKHRRHKHKRRKSRRKSHKKRHHTKKRRGRRSCRNSRGRYKRC